MISREISYFLGHQHLKSMEKLVDMGCLRIKIYALNCGRILSINCCHESYPSSMRKHIDDRTNMIPWSWSCPIPSMHGIFTYIWLFLMVKCDKCMVNIPVPWIRNGCWYDSQVVGKTKSLTTVHHRYSNLVFHGTLYASPRMPSW